MTVTFIGPGGRDDRSGIAYGAEPGVTTNWFVQGPEVTQLSGCAFGLSSSAPLTSSTTRPADPPR